MYIAHVCQQCYKRFTHSTSLKKHIRTNSSEKPCSCQEYNNIFTKSGNLKTHMQIYHSAETPKYKLGDSKNYKLMIDWEMIY